MRYFPRINVERIADCKYDNSRRIMIGIHVTRGDMIGNRNLSYQCSVHGPFQLLNLGVLRYELELRFWVVIAILVSL